MVDVFFEEKHMTTNPSVPVAQYLRMSTERQQYSMENQSLAIQSYAESHGFTVIQTYSDAARSGLVLKRRSGLRQLIQDVASGHAPYKAILVYDISRWGRFQDTDESAHYEFLCKAAGIPVHYCAEIFPNDGTLPSLIMKALKRTMAGEYSRELSVKVFAGHQRLARLGFKQGGLPGYGLRRMLLSRDREPKQQLSNGERKSIATDRVILVPGPTEEIEVVREIYRMFAKEKRSIAYIKRDLNRRGIKRDDGSIWKYGAVHKILAHPKYAGCHVYGQTSQKLCTPTIHLPQGQWVMTPAAFEAIIDETTYEAVQKVKRDRTANQTNDMLLARLRRVLAAKGRLSQKIIERSRNLPSASAYRHRFGSLRKAYELIGYGKPEDFGLLLDFRRRTQALRQQLIERIQSMFPDKVSVIRQGGRWRNMLQLDGFTVAVRTARCVKTKTGILKWIIDAAPRENDCIALLARLNPANDGIQDMHMFPCMKKNRFSLRKKDKWLEQGTRLGSLSEFWNLARLIAAASRK